MRISAFWIIWWLVCLLLASASFGQVYVEDYRGVEVDGVTLTTDDQVVRHAYKVAFEKTFDSQGNPSKNVTLYFDERVYRFYKLQNPENPNCNFFLEFRAWVWIASRGKARRSTRFIFYNVKPNQILVYVHSGYGGGMSGIVLRTAVNRDAHNVTGLHLASVSSFTVDQTDSYIFPTLGQNTNGIVIAKKPDKHNTESVVISNSNVRAANPVWVQSGDNITVEKCDLTSTPEGTAIFRGRAADNLVIQSVTGQKAKHAIFFEFDRVNSGMSIKNFRWEQGTPHGGAAWVVKNNRTSGSHALEFLNLEGCRHSPGRQLYSFDFEGILKETISGGYLPGPRLPEPESDPTIVPVSKK